VLYGFFIYMAPIVLPGLAGLLIQWMNYRNANKGG